MSLSSEDASLCERCKLLSFDDLAIGGQKVVDEDGSLRLSFKDTKTEVRPEYDEGYQDLHDYTLIRVGWLLDDILPDMPNLSHSSQLGCAFCSALHRELKEELVQDMRYYTIHDGPLTLIVYLSLVEKGVEGLLVEGTFNQEKGRYGVVQTFFPIEAAPRTDPAFDNCEKWIGAEPARETSYLGPKNISEMRRLLESCTKSCHPWEPSSFLPTRLIDIGIDSSAVPRLIFSSDIRQCEQAKYAALSYCWGTAEDAKTQFKTERGSLERRYENLPYELMTSAINDTIALTRAIGLRYVWVDAICIVQDDTDDWLRDSSQMNLVYRHAFVAFCGLNSNSCHESLLQRAPTIKVLFQSNIRQNINGHYLVRLRPRSGDWVDRKRLDYWCKWRERAWTFQEEELYSRLLLFGSSKMHFHCGTSEWSEGQDNITRSHSSKTLDHITGINQSKMSASNLYDTWLFRVHDYCGRSLTLEKDRLPAISGLACMIW
ncbi:HET-domain-containing protein [Karstenula rhodostoma CBS 690.94]|uniref:HET-domain-containing protein n=1 Tax=Karstenula rhodostoma CBS 690.94 TaxID=1392251 RepID=A0A9P4PR90_9PLEO|nr:HET-domain-containing protein [Karstenula rhodostoma CBS 690.94]